MDLEDTFSEAGYDVCGMVANVRDGLAAIERDAPECATLDYQLGSDTSDALAAALEQRGIPFCFISGRPDLLPEGGRTVLNKPATPRTVLRTVNALLEAH